MRRFLVGILALVPVVAVACGDDDDSDGQSGGAGGSSGSSGEAGAGGEKEPGTGGSNNTSTGGVGGESGGGGRNSAGGGGQGGGGDPRCEYDLGSYDGDTEGLCDAVEVNRCDPQRCGDYGAAISVLCAPDKSGCIHAPGVCTGERECGWIDCGVERDDPELCDELADVVHDVSLSGPLRCVRDEDCPAQSTCSRRIYNLMVCDPIDWSQGGNGGDGGGE